jgi:hypothetical protein
MERDRHVDLPESWTEQTHDAESIAICSFVLVFVSSNDDWLGRAATIQAFIYG